MHLTDLWLFGFIAILLPELWRNFPTSSWSYAHVPLHIFSLFRLNFGKHFCGICGLILQPFGMLICRWFWCALWAEFSAGFVHHLSWFASKFARWFCLLPYDICGVLCRWEIVRVCIDTAQCGLGVHSTGLTGVQLSCTLAGVNIVMYACVATS